MKVTFGKVFEVISSCETLDQLKVADRYSQLWFKRYMEENPSADSYEIADNIYNIISSTLDKIEGKW